MVNTRTLNVLRSPLVDLLVGPHGIDRYLELLRPELALNEARARVLEVRRQTPRSATIILEPNRAWDGFRAGQYVGVGLEIDGVRHRRTLSPASSEHDRSRLELTVTVHPGGRVSPHLATRLRRGALVHLEPAQGDFTLPARRPDQLVLISGGSGITPVMSMLRTLCDEGHEGRIDFLHFARTAEDWLYREEVARLAERRPGLRLRYLATREGDGHLCAAHLPELPAEAGIFVCGPPALIAAAEALWGPGRVRSETFTPPAVNLGTSAAEGTLRFARSEREAPVASGSLLEQAEAAGLSPEFGCRMGICHTCTCRKLAGPVRNVRTGVVSAEADEDIQLCISVPEGDVALDL